MYAAVINEFGQVPEYRQVPEPEVPDGQVLAQVRAAAIKNIERMLVDGTHYGSAQMSLPAQVGLDAVAVLPDGRRVYTGSAPPAGTMAEFIAVDPHNVIELPDDVDDAQAAAMPNAALSAWFALEFAGQMQADQTVLVLGATGVTGGLAVQLAKHQFGAGHVVAVGRNPNRLGTLADLGADVTVRIDEDFDRLGQTLRGVHEQQPFDLVIDYLWGQPAQAALGALANDDLTAEYHRTRYVQVGETAGGTIELRASVLRSAGVELIGQGAGSVPREAFARVETEILPALFTALSSGTISIPTHVRPLSEVAAAWDEPTDSGVRTVLVP